MVEQKAIKAEVPLAEMFGYATQMRSMSQVVRHTQWNLLNMLKLHVTWLKASSLNSKLAVKR